LNSKLHKFVIKQFERLPLLGNWRQNLIEERLWSHKRWLFVNWLFQRILGMNSDTTWSVHYTSKVQFPDRIRIGKGVRRSFAFSIGCYFQGYNGIIIGENTLLGPGTRILSANHEIENIERKAPPIHIGKHCWLGANVIILPGVTLGDNTIVGAGAVVSRSYPEGNVVLAGVPAKVVRTLSRQEQEQSDLMV
jgi:acetyltransferase-like isoleucine patch superfamily enzyme